MCARCQGCVFCSNSGDVLLVFMQSSMRYCTFHGDMAVGETPVVTRCEQLLDHTQQKSG